MRTPRLSTLQSALAVGALAASIASAHLMAGTQTPDGDSVVALIGKERLSASQVVAGNHESFDKQKSRQELKARQLQVENAQERYELLHTSLEKMLDRRALEMDSRAQGKSQAALLATLQAPIVSEEEARAYYEANKKETAPPFEQAQNVVIQFLAAQHNAQAVRKFYDGLRAKYGITSTLPPYRVQVAAVGPSLGKAQAPITIVEFADFQCPYCQRAEAALKSVISNHSDSVRLVFRNLPLSDIHPNATVAAVAGVCADKQGKFWDMHDAMFNDQSNLNLDGLKATAQRLGLNPDGFSACLADPQTRAALESDTHAADELNIKGTPYFFINGRPLYGSVPAEDFDSVIADELSRASDKRS